MDTSRYLRSILITTVSATALLCGIEAASAQCSGQIGAGTVCGNFTQSRGLPRAISVGPIFRPEDYGAKCDNSTDNTAFFQAMALAINTAKTGTVEFARNCVYRVVPNPTVGVGATFLSLAGLNDVTFNFNGSKFGTIYDFTTHANTAVYMFVLRNSDNITFNSPHFDQLNNHARGNGDRGLAGIYLISDGTGPVTNVRINNMRMSGGYIGFGCARGSSAARHKNITINNADISEVFYPLAFQRGCDNVTATGVNTTHPGRSYFAYNVSNHKIQLFSDANDEFNDLVISNYYDATDSVTLANETNSIEVQYTNRNNSLTGTGVSSYATVIFEKVAAAEGFQKISDIHLRMNVNRSDLNGGSVVEIANANTTAQGRLLHNVYISGDVSLNVSGPPAMKFMVDKDWTGDFVKNLQIDKFFCGYGGVAPIQIDGRGIVGPVKLSNITGNGTCTFVPTNMNNGTVTPFLSYEQVWLPGLIIPQAITVASLPTCDSTFLGSRLRVNDATATTFHSVAAGGGANTMEVFCNGSNWLIGG